MAVDSFKFKWPTIRAREDMRVALFFWTDPEGTAAYTIPTFTSYATSAHNDDNTSAADPPIAVGEADKDIEGGGTVNKLVVVYSAAQTGLLQASGFTNGRIDVWGIDSTTGRVKLAEAVWALDRSVTTFA